MRKTFKLFCAAVLAVLTVSSCGKIWDEFDAVHGELDGLEARIAELETKLNDQVAAINSTIGALDAKVAVTKVEKNDAGNYVLTFSNGETLEVSAADANANNTGLVTTVTEDGVTYWAVVGKDGKAVKLNAVVHPDTKLSFKVDPETNVLLVSYDGTNYESTGVVINDETTFNVVEKFVDAEGYVVLTVGGVEYKLPKVSTNYFEIVTGMQYFSPAQTKSLTVNMDGVISSMVASAPQGWTATLAKDVLKVTSPAGEHEVDNWGSYFYPANEGDMDSGEIVIWVVTEDGQTKVGTVNVAIAGAPAVFSFDKKYENVNVAFSVQYNGDAGVYFGACKADDFDAEAIAAKVASSMQELAEGVFTNYDSETGAYAQTAKYTVAELLGAAPEPAVPYIFWSVAPSITGYDMTTWMPIVEVDTDRIVLDYLTICKVDYKDPVVTFRDATIDVSVVGADEFYVGYAYGPAENYFGEYGTLSQETLDYLAAQGMTLKDVLVNGLSAYEKITYGKVCKTSYKGTLADLTEGEDYYGPGEELTVFVLPLPAGKTEFTVDDLSYYELTLPELKLGGEATVTFGEATDVKFNSFKLAAESTGELTYYLAMDAETYESMEAELAEYYLDMIGMFASKDGKSFNVEINGDWYGQGLAPKTEYVVVAFAVEADGSCGELVTTKVTTDDLPYSDALAVTSITGTVEDGSAAATFAITGNAVKLYYRIIAVTDWTPVPEETEYDAEILEALSADNWKYKIVKLDSENFKDGKVVLEDIQEISNTNPRVVMAFVQDADGNLSKLAKSNTFNTEAQAE